MNRNIYTTLFFAYRYLPSNRPVFTKFEGVKSPTFLGKPYLGRSEWLAGGRPGKPGFGLIHLADGLKQYPGELRHTWFHEVGHFVLGHVGGHTGGTIERKERDADQWAHNAIADLERVGFDLGDWLAVFYDPTISELRRLPEFVGGRPVASLA